MKLYIHDKQRLLGQAAIDRIESRAKAAFGKFRDDVKSIVITVEGVNGPREGIDRACKILVKLRNRKEFFLADKDVSASKVIASAIERVSRSVGRKLSRRRNRGYARIQFET